jgi:hypothetical protein
MKVARGNVDVSLSGDFQCRRCFDATPRIGQVAQPLRFHLRHFDNFSLGVVGGPLDAFLHQVLLANNTWPTIEEMPCGPDLRESHDRVLFTAERTESGISRQSTD